MLCHNGASDIAWITSQRFTGGEWSSYTKTVTVDREVKEAVFRFETDCTCAVFLNGAFIISGTGRLPERVNCHEVTARLKQGENTLRLVLGTAYFQEKGFAQRQERGYWLSSAAFELYIRYADGSVVTVPTDASWQGEADGKSCKTLETMRVTDAEYDMMWKHAAVWVEEERHKMPIDPAVLRVAGKEYAAYAKAKMPEYLLPQAVTETNMRMQNGLFVPDPDRDDKPYIVYDFGRLVVGFTSVAYTAGTDTALTLLHDYTESASDFDQTEGWTAFMVQKLSIRQTLKAGETDSLILRRRAFRYLKLVFDQSPIAVGDVRVRPCMFPAPNRGWFTCSDKLLNKAWEVGKYTLHVNKQQEYESCPRNEMEFFSGDGALDALVDLYAFGEAELMNASLSVKEDVRCGGVAYTAKFNKNAIQWDYFAWRILCMDVYYKATGNKEFLQTFYEEGKTALLWQLERVNQFGLMFQKPCFVSTYGYDLGQTEWTCSAARLGEKVALNALLYRSLVVMADMAEDMGEAENSACWRKRAGEVKAAINERLWSEEKQAYVDSLDGFIAEDGNTLAVLFGIADEKRAQAVLDTMKEKLWSPYGSAILDAPVAHARQGSKTVAPLMNAYECEARFLHGRAEEGLDLIRRCWGTMLKKGAETFWEFAPNNADEKWDIPSHAWSSGCTYLLSKYVLGLRLAGQSLHFEPHVCDLTFAKGVVPTVKGFAAASFTLTEDGKKFTLAVPAGIKVTYTLPENSTIELITY